ncbi:MAG: DMT family transporter [Bacteroidota bacterium]|nr:DMT family transporter [Bacteroidota bacterium]MDP3146072.1 DMT family transporter [Bacteroidota bacterium]MDP3558608.1 DMT family transporter [Bacteroidota bacterium]
MFGVSIALLTTICWSIGIFPFTEASKRFGTAALNQYRLFLGWLVISILILIFYPISIAGLFITPQFNHYLFLGLSGIIGFTIGDFFSFNSFKILGPKLGSLYTTIAPGAALLAGFLILKQEINVIGIFGIFITISGVIWLTLSKKDKKASEKAGFNRNPKGILFGVIGALCQGTGLVLSKLGLDCYPDKLPTLHAVWIRLLFAFSAAFIISIITGRMKANSITVFKNQNNGLPYMFLGTLFGPVLGVSFSLLAIQHLPVATAQTIFALLPIVVLPINYFYYKERITVQAIFACLIAVLGVFILIWSNAIKQWI